MDLFELKVMSFGIQDARALSKTNINAFLRIVLAQGEVGYFDIRIKSLDLVSRAAVMAIAEHLLITSLYYEFRTYKVPRQELEYFGHQRAGS
ncbi:hypothetical protein cyc_00432 [Cyclospora cayetanensis]|uniref:Uncharacterized protein n=1 Tax=Cyclospora cayetanensis TaxID=88456 RepID=A0A1D3D831_9EIME|nr:hypothetical protein cyc_00432 [Cyclospora cayetanensis]